MIEWKIEIKGRLAELKLDPTREAQILEELAQHLEDRFRELRSGGANHEEAHRAIQAELSDELLAKELRRVRRATKVDPMVALRYE